MQAFIYDFYVFFRNIFMITLYLLCYTAKPWPKIGGERLAPGSSWLGATQSFSGRISTGVFSRTFPRGKWFPGRNWKRLMIFEIVCFFLELWNNYSYCLLLLEVGSDVCFGNDGKSVGEVIIKDDDFEACHRFFFAIVGGLDYGPFLLEETRSKTVNLSVEVHWGWEKLMVSVQFNQMDYLTSPLRWVIVFMTPNPYSFLKGMCLVSEKYISLYIYIQSRTCIPYICGRHIKVSTWPNMSGHDVRLLTESIPSAFHIPSTG